MSEWEHDRSEFDAFQSIPALLAYVHRIAGDDGVQYVLTQADLRRETLVDSATTLKALGLTDLAKLVRACARKAQPTPIEALPLKQRMAARRKRA